MAVKIRTSHDLKLLGTILSIWAHPDDETYLAGGLMAAAVGNDQTVVCVTATKGEAGSQDPERWPTKTLAKTRAHELEEAMKIIGVKQHTWLDYHDGQCADVDLGEAAAKLSEIIKKFEPNTILTFGPDGLTGHPDHQAVSNWVSQAVKVARSSAQVYHAKVDQSKYDDYLKAADAKLNIFYNIDQPPLCDGTDCDICFTCSADQCTTKRRALAAMPSQTAGLLTAFDTDFVNHAFDREVFERAR